VEVPWSPISFAYPDVPTYGIAPGISYSQAKPQGYTAFDEGFVPVDYNPFAIQSNVADPPLIYSQFNSLPLGYQPLGLGSIQQIIDALGGRIP
jgi:hypothetical protein